MSEVTAAHLRKPVFAYIAMVWPEPTSSAAGWRSLQLMEIFKRAGYETHCLSSSMQNQFSESLQASGVHTHPVLLNDSKFDQLIQEIDPSIVMFDRFVTEEQFSWRVKNACPEATRVLDTCDLHFLRKAREAALKNGSTLAAIQSAEIPLKTEDAIREVAAIYRSDLTLVVSDFELQLLIQKFQIPTSLLELSRLLCPKPSTKNSKNTERWSFKDKTDFVFIGNFRHNPNADAVRWLKQELWMKIRKSLPTTSVHIYGAYPPKDMMAFHDPRNGFLMHGHATDALEAIAMRRINLAPLRFGAGIKGKLIDGWRVGTPCVATSIAAEGMTDEYPLGGLIGNDAESFANAAISLYQDESQWTLAQQHGNQLLHELYDFDAGAYRLLNQVTKISSSLESHRASNFIGDLLWHQMHRSTEYFSRWLELKNAL